MISTLVKLPIVASVLLGVAWVLGSFVLPYTVLKLLHAAAFVTLGAGLVGVLVMDLRARMSRRFDLLVESIEGMLMFYYRVVTPGSLLILLSGFSMVFGYYGLKALDIPWLAGMMVLFVFEFFEGHLIMKFHYLKLKQAVERSKQAGASVPELDRELRARLTLATHFLDVPNFALIVALGIVRPSDWTFFSIGLSLVVVFTAWLTWVVPRRYPWLATETLSAAPAAH
jgi:uncharacterized membrane protein